ncbi:hypothetical protein SAMD00019534_117600 [Acytostelium subglobosum LB1]|uniref:hypothetical protein n=1 Tax=Acytostelium subglobosum LB1 TaxID=1410327 RepID=UPI00064496E2|nr:hypothetical protein SAMD00019534_117600 [Acytostelium subglobosum LB1]GAM28584.1 hypothetical protein SAMD00019534_117600 [Acytostelium subglobosum LB1]|eukprot:XP_012748362.1 hypothetical protein SAMD00019534_117600 [Acytostelium subglobosum LB1]
MMELVERPKRSSTNSTSSLSSSSSYSLSASSSSSSSSTSSSSKYYYRDKGCIIPQMVDGTHINNSHLLLSSLTDNFTIPTLALNNSYACRSMSPFIHLQQHQQQHQHHHQHHHQSSKQRNKIWRTIANLIVRQCFYPVVHSSTEEPGISRRHNFREFITRLSLVSRTWADRIVPHLQYGHVEISTKKEFELIYRLTQTGLYRQRFRFASVSISLLAEIDTHVSQLHRLPPLADDLQVELIISNQSRQWIMVNEPSRPEKDLSIKSIVSVVRQQQRRNTKQHVLALDSGAMASGAAASSPVTKMSISLGVSSPQQLLTERLLDDLSLMDLHDLYCKLNKNNCTIHTLNIQSSNIDVVIPTSTAASSSSSTGTSSTHHPTSITSAQSSSNLTYMPAMLPASLSLHCSGVCSTDGQAIASIIETYSNIHTLDIGGNSLGRDTLERILESLCNNSSITKLCLASTPDLNDALLAKYIRTTTSLQCLDLSSNNLGQFTETFDALSDNSSLTSLNVMRARLKLQAKKNLCQAISNHRSLRLLNLSKYCFYEDLVEPMCTIESVLSNQTLTDIDLSFNYIDAKNTKLIADWLSRNQSVTRLSLDRNPVGEGFSHLLEAMTANNTLTYLSLSHCHLQSHAPPLFFLMLSTNQTLRRMNLRGNQLSDEAGHEIACVLPFNQSLQYLDLSFNRLTSTSALTLYKTLQYNKSLCHLELSGNSLGQLLIQSLFDKYLDHLRLVIVGDSSQLMEQPVVKNRNYRQCCNIL